MGRLKFAVLVAFGVAALGAASMLFAVRHYEQTTGRQFYGLAGYHYSVPEWGFAYHPGGERIEAWTVTYPLAATAVALLVSALGFAFRERRALQVVVPVLLAHFVAACAFGLFAAWISINVTGVFI